MDDPTVEFFSILIINYYIYIVLFKNIFENEFKEIVSIKNNHIIYDDDDNNDKLIQNQINN